MLKEQILDGPNEGVASREGGLPCPITWWIKGPIMMLKELNVFLGKYLMSYSYFAQQAFKPRDLSHHDA